MTYYLYVLQPGVCHHPVRPGLIHHIETSLSRERTDVEVNENRTSSMIQSYSLIPTAAHNKPALCSIRPQSHSLSDNLLHPSSLYPPNLLPERLNLLPAIQRPPIIPPQTSNNSIPSLFHSLIQLPNLLNLPPALQLFPQLLNLLLNSLSTQISERIASRLVWRFVIARLLVRELFRDVFEGLVFARL